MLTRTPEDDDPTLFTDGIGHTYQVSINEQGALRVETSDIHNTGLAVVPQTAFMLEIVATDSRVKRLTRRGR